MTIAASKENDLKCQKINDHNLESPMIMSSGETIGLMPWNIAGPGTNDLVNANLE